MRTAICVVTTLLVALGAVMDLALIHNMEWFAQDRLVRNGRYTAPNRDLVLVGFSQGAYPEGEGADAQKSRALKLLAGSYPWSREVWAELIERLLSAGARGVVLDIVFAGAREGDDRLAEVLRKHPDKVVIGYQVMDADKETGDGATLSMPSESVLPPSDQRPELSPHAGFVNIWPDPANVARTIRFRISDTSFLRQLKRDRPALPGEPHMESLSARALRMMGHPELIPPDEESIYFRFTSLGPERDSLRFDLIELNDVFAETSWRNTLHDGAFFKGKLVLVGPTGEIFHDTHRTPVADSSLPGPIVHLNVINAALRGELLHWLAGPYSFVLIVGAGALAVLLGWFTRNPVLRLFWLTLISAAYFGVSLLLYNYANLLWVLSPPITVLLLAGVGMLGCDFFFELFAKLQLRATMAFYFSPKVMEAVLANPGSMDAKSAQVTLLLTDLRNSTPLAEKLGPTGMFGLLNQVFEAETTAVMAQDGSLEHFLGDQFLTYWGAPQPQPDGANQALRAALALIKDMEIVKAAQPPEVQALFGFGVAIHCGSVLVGNKGSSKRLDYGLVGDTVNEAARIEALTKYYGVTLLVSREAFSQMSNLGRHRLLDRVIVKGKSTPVELFEIENPRTPPNYAELVKDWDAAFASYADGKFADARPVFAKLAEQFNDGPSKVMIHRCDELTAYPPADWKGVWKMESK